MRQKARKGKDTNGTETTTKTGHNRNRGEREERGEEVERKKRINDSPSVQIRAMME